MFDNALSDVSETNLNVSSGNPHQGLTKIEMNQRRHFGCFVASLTNERAECVI